jgi:SNF2 family DNA or RNA helicase
MNYSYELQKQSEDRIHRIGQNDKCTYFFLIAKNTVDKMIYNTVKNKGNLSKQTLDYLRGIE